MHPVKSGSADPGTRSKRSLNADDVVFTRAVTAGDISNLDDVRLMKIGTTVSRANNSDDKAEKQFLSVVSAPAKTI